MERISFIKTLTITPGQTESIPIPPDRYKALFFRLSGTTDTGQTLAASEVGTIRIQRGGRQIQGRKFSVYHELADLLGGFPEATLPTAGATAITAPIFFGAPGLPNSMEVIGRDELVLFYDPPAGLATEFGANAITVDIHGWIDELTAEAYELHLLSQDFTASAAIEKRESININNVAFLLLDDSSTVIDAVQFEVDGVTLIDRINDALLAVQNNLKYRVESGGNTLTIIPTAFGSNLAAYANRTSKLTLNFTGAGTVDVSVLSVQPSPRRNLDTSRTLVQRRRTEAAAKLRTSFGVAG